MPYFLCVDDKGIAIKGSEDFTTPPDKSWIPGTLENYLQQWDGRQWKDTKEAKEFRERQVVEQAELRALEEARQKERTRVEDFAKTVAIKVNELIVILNNRGERITPLPISPTDDKDKKKT